MDHDRLDELLSQLPSEPPSPGLSRQIRLALRQENANRAKRIRRTSRLRLGVGAALGTYGAWLVLPALLAWYLDLTMPLTGLSLSLFVLELAWQGLSDLIWASGTSILNVQAGFSQALDAAAVLGLMALALSALLALGALMPNDREVSR